MIKDNKRAMENKFYSDIDYNFILKSKKTGKRVTPIDVKSSKEALLTSEVTNNNIIQIAKDNYTFHHNMNKWKCPWSLHYGLPSYAQPTAFVKYDLSRHELYLLRAYTHVSHLMFYDDVLPDVIAALQKMEERQVPPDIVYAAIDFDAPDDWTLTRLRSTSTVYPGNPGNLRVVTFKKPHGGAYVMELSSFKTESEYLMYPGTRWVMGKDGMYHSKPLTKFDKDLKKAAALRRKGESKLMKLFREIRTKRQMFNSEEERTAAVSKLITKKSVKQPNGIGELPIHVFTEGGLEIAQLMLEEGMDINVETPWGWTAAYNMANGDYYPEDVSNMIDMGLHVGPSSSMDIPPSLLARSEKEFKIAFLYFMMDDKFGNDLHKKYYKDFEFDRSPDAETEWYYTTLSEDENDE